MTKEEFVVAMQDVLQTETELKADTVLGDLEEWDSLSVMATMTFLDKHFGIRMRLADFKGINTLGELMETLPLS